ncbi:hypothetical protein D6C98_05484 [Aureobasidium pullulans]|nr:hypothetical protein D6C98_05484 [Aureobasidium pullulans]
MPTLNGQYMHPLKNEDGTRNFYAKTPTQQYFHKLEDLIPLKNRSAQDILKLLPKEVQMVRRVLPQFEKLRGKNVMLVLGFCPKPDSDEVQCKTDKMVNALGMGGENPILSLDMRCECRRMIDDSGCFSITEDELEVLLASKVLELQIAEEEYGISIRSVLTFSGCWDDNRWNRILEASDTLGADPPPYYHESRHISWMHHYHIKKFTEKLSGSVMQEWTADQIFASLEDAGMVEGRLVPRVPEKFGARFKGMWDPIEDTEESEENLGAVKSKLRWRKTASHPDPASSNILPPHLQRDRVQKDGSRPYHVSEDTDEDSESEIGISRVPKRAAPTKKDSANPKSQKRGSYSAVACLSCQKGKEKCDGNSPCARCVRLKKECLPAPPRTTRSGKITCKMCREKKRYCNQGRPCDQCKARGQDCVYD